MPDQEMTKTDAKDVPLDVNTSGLTKEAKEMFDAIAIRAYQIFEAQGRPHGRDLEHWLQAEAELFDRPSCTLVESKDGVTVLAEVSGFAPKELEVDLEPQRVTIIGKHRVAPEHKGNGCSSAQKGVRNLLQTLQLPVEVDMHRATASLSRGILELDLKKAATAKRVRPGAGSFRHVV